MILSDELFRALTDRAPSLGDGQRAAARVPVSMQAAVLLLSGQSARGQLQSEVIDLSPIGVGLLLPQPLATGDQFAVRLRTIQGQQFWLVSKTARCVPRSDERFLIGAHFVRVLQLQKESDGTASALEIEGDGKVPPPAASAHDPLAGVLRV